MTVDVNQQFIQGLATGENSELISTKQIKKL